MTPSSSRLRLVSCVWKFVLASTVLVAALAPFGRAAAQTCYIQPHPTRNDEFNCCQDPARCAVVPCRVWRGRTNPHTGTDYNSGTGPLPAIADGWVHDILWTSCLGNVLILRHPDGMYSGYSHLSAIHVREGDAVGRGQHIANSGNTGTCSLGAHLHLSMGTTPGTYSGGGIDAYAYINAHSVCRPDRDGDGSYEGDDCDDNDAQRSPLLAESCDAIDNDCDDAIDEDVSRICGSDVGDCEQGVETCTLGTWGECVGEVPPIGERCDTRDNDCNGEADDDRICEYDDAAIAAALGHRASSDVDGDGRADACMRAPDGFECLIGDAEGPIRRFRGPAMSGATWSSPAAFGSIRMGDIDGDGRDDVCAREDDRVRCWGAGTDDFDSTLVSLPLDPDAMDPRSAQFWLADIDGDGRVDPCVRTAEGLRCQVAGEDAARTLGALSDARGWGDVARHGSIRFGDMNGDGRDDVCGRGERGITCWLADDVGFGEVRLGPLWTDADGWGEARYGSTLRLADVNGDAIDDVCARGPNGFACALGGTDGFETSLVRGPALRGDGYDARPSYATLRMGDVDGDGRDDLCVRVGESIQCWLAEEDGRLERRVNGPVVPDAEGWSDALAYGSLRLADVTGDGLGDFCGRTGEGLSCWISEGNGFPELRRIPVWRDVDGAGDPSFASTLTIAGHVGGEPRGGGCGCVVAADASRPPGAWFFGLFALAVVRRGRRPRG